MRSRMVWRYASMYPWGLYDVNELGASTAANDMKVDQPGRLARHQVQAVIDALRADGKHLPLSSRLPDPPAKPPAARCVPDSRPLRRQRPRASPTMHHVLQSQGQRRPAQQVSPYHRATSQQR